MIFTNSNHQRSGMSGIDRYAGGLGGSTYHRNPYFGMTQAQAIAHGATPYEAVSGASEYIVVQANGGSITASNLSEAQLYAAEQNNPGKTIVDYANAGINISPDQYLSQANAGTLPVVPARPVQQSIPDGLPGPVAGTSNPIPMSVAMPNGPVPQSQQVSGNNVQTGVYHHTRSPIVWRKPITSPVNTGQTHNPGAINPANSPISTVNTANGTGIPIAEFIGSAAGGTSETTYIPATSASASDGSGASGILDTVMAWVQQNWLIVAGAGVAGLWYMNSENGRGHTSRR